MTIDYTNLNQQITKQAIGNLILTEEMKQRLFAGKLERARVELASRQLPVKKDK